jgi:hypothetical protein
MGYVSVIDDMHGNCGVRIPSHAVRLRAIENQAQFSSVLMILDKAVYSF